MLNKKRGKWFISSELAFLGASNRQEYKIVIDESLTSPIHHIISEDIIKYKTQLEEVIGRYKLQNKFSTQELINSN